MVGNWSRRRLGVYSIRGKSAGDATRTTAGNFLRAATLAVVLNLAMLPASRPATLGIVCAMASGALTSGIGYAIWYSAIRGLKATHAATVQLSVPVLAAAGGIIFLGEAISTRLVIASVAIPGGLMHSWGPSSRPETDPPHLVWEGVPESSRVRRRLLNALDLGMLCRGKCSPKPLLQRRRCRVTEPLADAALRGSVQASNQDRHFCR